MACLFKLALPSSHTSVGKMSMKISLASSWFHLWSGKITIIWRSLWRYHDEAVVFCAFHFFIFFGFADEARKNYRYAFQSVAKRVGLSTASSTTYVNGINSLDYGFEGCVFIIILFREGFSRWLDNLNIQKEIENRQFIRESSSYSSRIRSQRDASTSRFYELLQQHVHWRR